MSPSKRSGRPQLAILSVVMVIALAACSSASSGNSAVKIYCAKSAFGCHCQNTDFTLSGDETATPDCDSPPQGAECTFDLDATGASTKCDCTTWHCYGKSTYDCTCSSYGAASSPGSGTEVSSCVKNPVTSSSYPSWCCNSGYQCACGTDSPTVVTPCTPNGGAPNATSCTKPPAPGNNSAASCSGVKWAPPPPPSSSGGGSSSGGTHCGANGTSCSSSSDCCGYCEMDSTSSEYLTCQ